MHKLKDINEVDKQDPIWKHFKLYDPQINEYRVRTIKDHYSFVNKISLNNKVSTKIKGHFEISRNLLLFSWYHYRFITVAEHYAYISVEFALKEKSGKENWGLKRLIKYAIDNRWIKDEKFKNFKRIQEEKNSYESMIRDIGIENRKFRLQNKKYIDILLDAIPSLRNIHAHGENILHPSGFLIVEICADFINQLYD